METILIIDDDVQLMDTARKLLEHRGYDVMTRTTGFDSTNFLARHVPDLVLLDINMPFLSGDKLIEIFKEHRTVKEIPIVFFSSNDENSLRLLVNQTGALGYISKSEMGMEFPAKVAFYLQRAKRTAV